MGRHISAIALGTVLALAAWSAVPAWAANDPAASDGAANRGPEVGAAAPDFTLPGIDGQEITLGDLRGRAVVLVFFRGAW